MLEFSFEIVPILIGTVVSFVIGAIWYSPVLFSKPWMELVGLKPEDMSGASAAKAMAYNVLTSFIAVVSLYQLYVWTGVSETLDTIILGLVVGLGIVAMVGLNKVFFAKQDFQLFLIDNGYIVIQYAVIVGLFAVL